LGERFGEGAPERAVGGDDAPPDRRSSVRIGLEPIEKGVETGVRMRRSYERRAEKAVLVLPELRVRKRQPVVADRAFQGKQA
jgi:hypothetical protein